MHVTPAILPENYEQILDKLFKIEGAVSRVQIDLCDGSFGLEKTWLPYREVHLPADFDYEFDLMVHDWTKYLPRVLALNAKRIIVHVDNFRDEDYDALIAMVKDSGVTIGLCVSNDKDAIRFSHIVQDFSKRYRKHFIQVMGIKKIGAQGQPFDETCLKRIEYFSRHCKHTSIQVDGAMNNETILRVKKAGADTVVVGSYIFSGDNPLKRIKELERSFSRNALH